MTRIRLALLAALILSSVCAVSAQAIPTAVPYYTGPIVDTGVPGSFTGAFETRYTGSLDIALETAVQVTPVPEPSPWPLFAVGLAGILMIRRRARQA